MACASIHNDPSGRMNVWHNPGGVCVLVCMGGTLGTMQENNNRPVQAADDTRSSIISHMIEYCMYKHGMQGTHQWGTAMMRNIHGISFSVFSFSGIYRRDHMAWSGVGGVSPPQVVGA